MTFITSLIVVDAYWLLLINFFVSLGLKLGVQFLHFFF